MRNLFYVVLACAVLACSDDAPEEKTDIDIDFAVFPQKWVLVQMTGNVPHSTTTGVEMNWQENYRFNKDLTFLKVRTRDGITTQASGSYTKVAIGGENHLVLTYSVASDLIGNCNSTLTEDLWLKSPGKMSSTWLVCDGPGLDYERVE
ncbi:MAG: hypothetical protein DI538_26435 [Azospira oryzae]|nr:hypothetical protein [Cytophaga sp.]PZR26493.1 MAG: hypothetical protein DI538_26435 [Azospira oryzae]